MFTKSGMIAALTAASFATSLWAQSEGKTDHSAHGGGYMVGYMATMDTMMESMKDMTSSGDADADFLLMMIPHHQSAIDMVRVQLEEGDDEETREMAQEIIDAQEQEIAEMSAMLKRLGVAVPE